MFRASKDIYAETGVRGLLQGHSATLIRIFPYAAIKFMAYDKIHGVCFGQRSGVLALLADEGNAGRETDAHADR